MDLYSGMPYWIAKNPLSEDRSTDGVIIGSGIDGKKDARHKAFDFE